MKYLQSTFLKLFALTTQLLAFDETDLKKGLVIKVDLPGGYSVFAPAYFEVKEVPSGHSNSVSFNDPEGYVYCGANLLPKASFDVDKFGEMMHSGMKKEIVDAEVGELITKHFTIGDSTKVTLFLIPIEEPNKMEFHHLLVQAEENILHVGINVTGVYEGKNAGMEAVFARQIMLSLRDPNGLKLKKANQAGDDNSE